MERAPFHEEIAGAPPGGRTDWVAAQDGMKLRMAAWPAQTEARGTVFLFNGRTEYIEKYGPAAAEYTGRGYAVVTLDWRGQGLTARALDNPLLGHVVDFDEYQQDVAAMAGYARALELPEPWYLVGHSMGGCIALRALHGGFPARAVAFSAPMWGVQMEWWERPMAWVTTRLAPLPFVGRQLTPRTDLRHALIVDAFEGNDLTTDRAMWDFMKRQIEDYPALELGGPSLRWLRAALAETRALMAMAPPPVPALTFLGTHERIVLPGPIRRHMARWQGGTLEMIERAEHEIMMERPEVRGRFFEQSAQLFAAHA